MFTSLHIQGFRAFERLSMPVLTRVNLIVGKNNAGKTSILDAVEVAARRGDVTALTASALRRDERSIEVHLAEEDPRGKGFYGSVNLSHMFHGHAMLPGAAFSIDAGGASVKVSVEPAGDTGDALTLSMVAADGRHGSTRLLVSPAGNLPDATLARNPPGAAPVVFVPTRGLGSRQVAQAWEGLVLTPEEDHVLASLRIVEPRLARLAFVDGGRPVVTLTGAAQRLPLGSLGDGMRRLLDLSIAAVMAKGGVLLVDEIDTGLHYSALESMWNLVVQTARRLDLQVFATSHSGDCLRALAWLHELDPDLATDISVHRVEAGLPDTVRYSAEQIEVAARHHIEVRG